MRTSVMRKLRLKHGVSLAELARAANRSSQYISSVELGEWVATDSTKALMAAAFERVIRARNDATAELAKDYAEKRDRLLDFIEESGKDGQ